jgi:actin cytoskeleton-regulatory complex protein PAN1
LEEQVKLGKVKKEEEKRRKQQAQREAKEKEARLAAHRADLEAAKERERQLQLQLESLGNDESSDDEGPQTLTPQDKVPAANRDPSTDISPHSVSAMPSAVGNNSHQTSPSTAANSTPILHTPTISTGPTPVLDGETKNPFLKKMA